MSLINIVVVDRGQNIVHHSLLSTGLHSHRPVGKLNSTEQSICTGSAQSHNLKHLQIT